MIKICKFIPSLKGGVFFAFRIIFINNDDKEEKIFKNVWIEDRNIINYNYNEYIIIDEMTLTFEKIID
jgi:hypothetical protein